MNSFPLPNATRLHWVYNVVCYVTTLGLEEAVKIHVSVHNFEKSLEMGHLFI